MKKIFMALSIITFMFMFAANVQAGPYDGHGMNGSHHADAVRMHHAAQKHAMRHAAAERMHRRAIRHAAAERMHHAAQKHAMRHFGPGRMHRDGMRHHGHHERY